MERRTEQTSDLGDLVHRLASWLPEAGDTIALTRNEDGSVTVQSTAKAQAY